MQIWDAFIHNGNREFEDENFEFALGHYEQALKQANAMLHTKHNIHCVTSFIDNTQTQVKVNRILISHCLLANCYFELNWSKKGCEQYEIAYQFLKSAIILSTDNQLQLSALKATKQLKHSWIDSLKKYRHSLPEFKIIRRYAKSLCSAYNFHNFSNNGV